MDNKEFVPILEEVLGKIADETNIICSNITLPETKKAAVRLDGLLSAIRVPIRYIMLDLEATRRERDILRMALEDRD